MTHSDNPASMGVPKKGKYGGCLGTHVTKSVVLACSIDYVARRVGAADLGYREVYGRGGQGRGRACNAWAPCDRAAAPARRPPGAGGWHAVRGPLAARRDRGAGRRKGRAAVRPVRGRAAGRLDDGFRAAKGRRGGLGGSGVPARSRTRTLQDPGQSALQRLQNVTPRNAARGTRKSSLRLGIGSYGSGGRLAAGHLVRLGA